MRCLTLQIGTFVSVYFAVRGLTAQGWLPAALRWHLSDLVCLPLVLGLALLAQRLWRMDSAYRLPWWHGLSAWGLYAVYFEGVLPRLNASATADPVDVLCYLAGWGVFECGVNRVTRAAPRPEPV